MDKKLIKRIAFATVCSLAVFGMMVLFGENAIARTTPFPSNITISDDSVLFTPSSTDAYDI